MKKYTANYSYSNHNFVIQNLNGKRMSSEYLAGICILKNILQRGKPTLQSTLLQDEIGSIHNSGDFQNGQALISNEKQTWERIIRGDEKGNYYPAKKFIEELIPKYFGEFAFVQNLIIPEVPINDILKIEVDEFSNQQVDFYLPQAYLIIEIDGSQHKLEKDKEAKRDAHTSKYGIHTVRITTRDLEDENEVFLNRISDILSRIENVANKQKKRKELESTFISLYNYQTAFTSDFDLTNPYLKSTAIIRFQILLLELVEQSILKIGTKWSFEVVLHENFDFINIAIKDLDTWLHHIYKLQKIKFTGIDFDLTIKNSVKEFSSNEAVKVDFSLTKRYTDEFQLYKNVLFVRTDYFDEYLYFKKGNSTDSLAFSSFEPYDYFRVSTTTTVKYKLNFGGEHDDEKSLLFLLWNIFLQNDQSLKFEELSFREGQIPIIANALNKNDTIGLLPTGSGKSVCYQLSAILQPAISFVVCPIKSLMYDQKADLDNSFISRTNHITSDDDGEDKAKIQNEFGQGKYFFIFISPERFQLKTFRQYFRAVDTEFNIAYAVIDEVHCLSEWGHDFRTSYLNLSNTIQRLCSNFNWIGLTATASINVLKNIQIEFGIKQQDVKTPVDYTRKELEFIVIDDENNKDKALNHELQNLIEYEHALELHESKTKCGIVFTPTVNGRNGCYPLSLRLSQYFGADIRYYSGSIPKVERKPIMGEKEFDQYKKKVQSDFKKNKFPILTATKAFGMGVNKGNIYYTFHYGIPGSMEALYQEAGRAGRDKTKFVKNKAKCFVLLSKTNDESILHDIWERNTTLTKVNELQKQTRGDINTNLFLFSLGLEVINKEFKVIKDLFGRYAVSNKKDVKVRGAEILCDKTTTEKAIYRLCQLGVIEDWTISNFFSGGEFQVDFSEYSAETIKKSLLSTISDYDKEFSFEKIVSDDRYKTYNKILNAPDGFSDIDKQVLILLQWSYDNFAYNRRQSLKNIYELCSRYESTEQGKEEFKRSLESYFKFNQASYIIQHIAENPLDYTKWFDVFYQVENNKQTTKFISKRQQENLRDNLSRFLESYMQNTGLDLISGLIRLLLNDYENIDGKERLESSLNEIRNFDLEEQETIINKILKIGVNLSDKNKNHLAESLYKNFNSYERLLQVSKELGDTFSMTKMVEVSEEKLRIINNKIYGGFRKIG